MQSDPETGRTSDPLEALLAGHPAARAALRALSEALAPAEDGGLSPAEREAVAVVVSAANNCAFHVGVHAARLAEHERDNERLKRIVSGFQFMDLPDRTARILSYAVKLTTSPAQVDQDDRDSLAAAGLDSAQMVELNLVVAHANMLNRLALGMGMGGDLP